ILEAVLDAQGGEVLADAVELASAHRERDVPEPRRLRLARRRRAELCLEEPDARAEPAHEDGPVVRTRLVHLLEPEHVRVPGDRARAVGDVERDVVESPQAERDRAGHRRRVRKAPAARSTSPATRVQEISTRSTPNQPKRSITVARTNWPAMSIAVVATI